MNLEELYTIIQNRKEAKPENSYVATLFKKGNNKILQKIGEEATEVIIAGKNNSKKRKIEEVADLLFHICVFLNAQNISLRDIFQEFEKRKR